MSRARASPEPLCRRGVLVGEHTFGKGLIQRVFPMPNGGALKLTVGEYMRPTLAPIEPGVGLEPDLPCLDTPRGAAEPVDACVDMAVSVVRGRAPKAVRPLARLPLFRTVRPLAE